MVQEFSQVSRLHLQLLQRYRDNEILVTQQKNKHRLQTSAKYLQPIVPGGS